MCRIRSEELFQFRGRFFLLAEAQQSITHQHSELRHRAWRIFQRSPCMGQYLLEFAGSHAGRGQQRVRFPNLRTLHECRFECFYRTGMVAPR